jgi:ABC-type transport system involved in multi-copper enzyme maturation permease subunit
MRLIRAELLKMRRRTATYVVLAIPLVLLGLITIIAAGNRDVMELIGRFPQVYATVLDYPLGGLGTLLAMAYAAAIAGADWNWGVLRNVIARGESREGYQLAKAVAIAIVLSVGVLIIFVVGLLATIVLAMLSGVRIGDPLSPASLGVLRDQVLLGFPVMLERAAIGFAVAVVLRSQVAGVVAGIVLLIGETIIRTILTAASFSSLMFELEITKIPVQWFQFLPFAIGDEVRAAASSGGPPGQGGDILGLFLTHVDLPVAFVVLMMYLFGALAIAMFAVRREQIVA